MKTLSFIRPPGSSAAMYVGPEDIVRAAEDLGAVSIERSSGWNRSSPYEAEITFHNRNGSRIHAKGSDMDFFTAIAKAVQEAERLK